MHFTNSLLLIGILGLSLNSCGEKASDKSDENKNDSTPGIGLPTAGAPKVKGNELIANPSLSSPIISASIEESLSALTDDPEVSGAGFRLNDDTAGEAGMSGKLQLFRSCTEEEDAAKVSIQRRLNKEVQIEGPVRIFDIQLSMSADLERTWTKVADAIDCHSSGKYAAVPVADMAGVQLDITLNRQKERIAKVTHKKSGDIMEVAVVYEATGTRSVIWDSVTETAEGLVIAKTAQSSVDHTLLIASTGNDERAFAGTLAVSEEAPLKIEVLRDASTLAALEKKITSGLVTAESAQGSITAEFDQVIYQMGSCMPESGTISGLVTAADSQESVTYTITFNGNSQASIEFSTGDTFDYDPHGCDLESSGGVTEVEEPMDEVK